MHPTFILRFWEGVNGPYEIRGNAFALYRAAVSIGGGPDKHHVRYVTLREDGSEIRRDEFMDECLNVTSS